MPESKHRSLKSLKFVKFLYKDIAFYAALPDDEVGKRIKNLMVCMLSMEESQYKENNAMMEEAMYYLERKAENIAAWKRKKKDGEGKKAAAATSSEPGLFATPAVPSDWQSLPKHELERLILNTGQVTANDFHKWHEASIANNWADRWGHPIRNPLAACLSYTRQSQSTAADSGKEQNEE